MTESFDGIRFSYNQSRCASAAEALNRRGFNARWFATAGEAVDAMLEVIPTGSRVGVGGSVTLRETGTLERLQARGDTVVRHNSDMEFAESLSARRESITCPYFLCSSNAVTMEGELVNTDGIGNRVAGMIFGPDTVIILAGVNKIVADRDEAISRIRNVAAPANARRLGIDVPCVERGQCVDCKSPMNICRVTTIISLKPILTGMMVFLVAEPLGL